MTIHCCHSISYLLENNLANLWWKCYTKFMIGSQTLKRFQTALEKLCGNLIHLFVACFIVLLVLLPWHLFFHNVNYCNGHFRVHSWQGFLTHHCIVVTLQHASELAPQLTRKGGQLRIQLFYLQDLFLTYCCSVPPQISLEWNAYVISMHFPIYRYLEV